MLDGERVNETRQRRRLPLQLHETASAETVAMLRVGVFLLCAAEGWILLRQATPLPRDAFVPFGFLLALPDGWLELLRSVSGQRLLFGAAGLSALAAACGLAPRVSLPLGTVLFVVSQAVPRAFQGLVNHAQVPVMLAALVLTLGASADALRLWPRKLEPTRDDHAYQATLIYIVAAICIGYAFIAAHRVAYGGLSLFLDDSLRQWLVLRNLGAVNPESSLGVRVVHSPFWSAAARVAFPAMTVLELCAPFCLFSARFRRLFVPLMLSAHVAIFLLMRISFSQLAVLYIVFIDASVWSPRRAVRNADGSAVPLTVFFDGVCGLCNRFIDFLLVRDRAQRLQFAPLQGPTAQNFPSLPRDVDSVITHDGHTVLVRSDAALAAIGRLGGLWSFAAVLGLVPRPVRDAVYDFVARNRYGWFGKHDTCRLPSPEERAWFLP